MDILRPNGITLIVLVVIAFSFSAGTCLALHPTPRVFLKQDDTRRVRKVRLGLIGMNFYATLGSQAEVDLFLRLVRLYKIEQCNDCEYALPKSAEAQSRRWRGIRDKPLVKFDWNCASPAAYPRARLDRIVRTTMKRGGFAGVGTPNDRAFIFDLNGDRKPEYFVPLECGATGNCTWGVFGLNPARSLGLVNGQYIYVHKRAGRWPDIITYGHFSVAEGNLGTYSFRKRGYAWLGDSYPTEVRGGIYGNKMPGFLERARAACENIGS